MRIRDATPEDWAAIWPFFRQIVAAGDTFATFNAVAESNALAVALYRSLGFAVLATIPEGFRHPTEGYVGLLVMYRRL